MWELLRIFAPAPVESSDVVLRWFWSELIIYYGSYRTAGALNGDGVRLLPAPPHIFTYRHTPGSAPLLKLQRARGPTDWNAVLVAFNSSVVFWNIQNTNVAGCLPGSKVYRNMWSKLWLEFKRSDFYLCVCNVDKLHIIDCIFVFVFPRQWRFGVCLLPNSPL